MTSANASGETFMATVDALVMGRKTYEVVRGFGGDWPYAGTPVVVLSHGQPILPEGAEVEVLALSPADVLAKTKQPLSSSNAKS